MSQDNTQHDPHTTSTPPDRAAQGDVSTTGHSTYDAQGPAPDAHGDHDAHDAHGGGHGGGHGHGVDTSDVPTLVPTTWRQLVLPALILLLVTILVSGPIINAFAYRPAAAPHQTEQTEPGHGDEGEGGGMPGSPTDLAHVESTATTAVAPTRTSAPTAPATATTATTATEPTATLSPGDRLSPTQTAVADAGQRGIVARVPVELNFAGTTFVVRVGDTLLPDWEPNTDPGTATWIEGTVANHVLYVPFSDENLALFTSAKPGDIVTLTMNTGQVFEFEVNRAERVPNGPPTRDGQFTVTTAMSQDHAGVTLFLIGDPAADRAVLQAEFTGNIQ